MKRGAVFIGATAVAAAVLFSVFHDKLDNVPVSGGAAPSEYHDAGKPIETTAGREFMIVLEADRTSGLRWQLIADLDKSLLQVVEIKRNASKTKQGGRQVKDLWVFRGLREGKVLVSFAGVHPGGSDGMPSGKKIFTVIIIK